MSTSGEVLVVDDEPTITEIVALYLGRAGHATRVADDGPGALAAVAARRPDLVLLDLMLPAMDGFEVMRRLRAAPGSPPPVVVLTARDDEAGRGEGVALGAEDWIVKPFSPSELVARVEAVLRRTRAIGGPPVPLRFDGLTVDVAARRAHRDAHELALTGREFDLLAFLVEHPGTAFSREHLLAAVWPDGARADTTTVTAHVRALRAKLEPDPTAAHRLETVWGVGYRFRP